MDKTGPSWAEAIKREGQNHPFHPWNINKVHQEPMAMRSSQQDAMLATWANKTRGVDPPWAGKAKTHSPRFQGGPQGGEPPAAGKSAHGAHGASAVIHVPAGSRGAVPHGAGMRSGLPTDRRAQGQAARKAILGVPDSARGDAGGAGAGGAGQVASQRPF